MYVQDYNKWFDCCLQTQASNVVLNDQNAFEKKKLVFPLFKNTNYCLNTTHTLRTFRSENNIDKRYMLKARGKRGSVITNRSREPFWIPKRMHCYCFHKIVNQNVKELEIKKPNHAAHKRLPEFTVPKNGHWVDFSVFFIAQERSISHITSLALLTLAFKRRRFQPHAMAFSSKKWNSRLARNKKSWIVEIILFIFSSSSNRFTVYENKFNWVMSRMEFAENKC